MTKHPLVSIIINNYNYGRYLEEAIDSALKQTYHNVEVIVVDDGSTDNSRDIISKYGDRIIPVFKENGGQGSAFNAGFEVSSGQIIIFLDSDDVLYDYAVEKVVDKFQSNDKLVKVHYRLDIVDHAGNKTGNLIPNEKTPLLSGDISDIVLKYGPGSYTNPPTTGNAFSRNALEKVFPMPTEEYRICADGYLFMTVPFFGEVGSINTPLGKYRIHQSNGFWQTSLNIDKLHKQVELYQARVKHLRQLLDRLNIKQVPTRWSAPFSQVTRITTLKLDPLNHKILNDKLIYAYKDGILSTWFGPIPDLRRKFFLTVYIHLMIFLPKTICRKLATWLFVPDSRPKFLKGL